jgi:hypothetical protein
LKLKNESLRREYDALQVELKAAKESISDAEKRITAQKVELYFQNISYCVDSNVFIRIMVSVNHTLSPQEALRAAGRDAEVARDQRDAASHAARRAEEQNYKNNNPTVALSRHLDNSHGAGDIGASSVDRDAGVYTGHYSQSKLVSAHLSSRMSDLGGGDSMSNALTKTAPSSASSSKADPNASLDPDVQQHLAAREAAKRANKLGNDDDDDDDEEEDDGHSQYFNAVLKQRENNKTQSSGVVSSTSLVPTSSFVQTLEIETQNAGDGGGVMSLSSINTTADFLARRRARSTHLIGQEVNDVDNNGSGGGDHSAHDDASDGDRDHGTDDDDENDEEEEEEEEDVDSEHMYYNSRVDASLEVG